MTNYHLVSGAASVVGFNNKKKEVDVEGILAVNKALDLALVRIKGRTTPLVPAPEALAKGKKFWPWAVTSPAKSSSPRARSVRCAI